MKTDRIIVWFRQDLRIHDNESLTKALERAEEVIPVFVFDERIFKGETSYGFKKCDKFRTKFIIESVEDLRKSLRKLGTELYVRVGRPEEEVAQICKETGSDCVICNMERTREEVFVQNELEKALWKDNREINYFRGKMLYYTQDLPFPVSHCPDVFTAFRKEVEKYVNVRAPLPSPSKIEAYSGNLDAGTIPKLEDFGFDSWKIDARQVISFNGGESAGLERLNNYVWKSEAVKTYVETRNGLLGANYSSKFSPWLAQGCLSPKMIYHEIKKFERNVQKNNSTYHLIFELLWRDFFRLMGKKHGDKIFEKTGISKNKGKQLTENKTTFEMWKEGRTGVPFIDANMKELNKTGWMSNRGRQNVASYLINDLKVDWRMGAEYMESLLLDYDPCSNWGNWQYIAGVGSDPRPDRYFNPKTQAKKYDPEANYIKTWLTELKNSSVEELLNPNHTASN